MRAFAAAIDEKKGFEREATAALAAARRGCESHKIAPKKVYVRRNEMAQKLKGLTDLEIVVNGKLPESCIFVGDDQ